MVILFGDFFFSSSSVSRWIRMGSDFTSTSFFCATPGVLRPSVMTFSSKVFISATFSGMAAARFFRFAEVNREVVELHGLRLIAAFAPAARSGRGDVFPISQPYRGHTAD